MKVFIAVASGILMLFIAPLIEQAIWNTTLVEIFNLPEISYWSMFAINWFCGLLFRSSVSSSSSYSKED